MTTPLTSHGINEISCPECGHDAFSEEDILHSFTYGSGEDAVTLSAQMPIIACQNCGYEYFDHRGEEAQHHAVCKHLGVLTPQEISAIRQGLNLTRSEFAGLAGIGEASLQRWESGSLIQNRANDRIIYLMQFEIVRRLLAERISMNPARPSLVPSPSCATESDQVRQGAIRNSESTDARILELAADSRILRNSGVFANLMSRGEIFYPSLCHR